MAYYKVNFTFYFYLVGLYFIIILCYVQIFSYFEPFQLTERRYSVSAILDINYVGILATSVAVVTTLRAG